MRMNLDSRDRIKVVKDYRVRSLDSKGLEFYLKWSNMAASDEVFASVTALSLLKVRKGDVKIRATYLLNICWVLLFYVIVLRSFRQRLWLNNTIGLLPVSKLAPPYDSPPYFLTSYLTTYFHYLLPTEWRDLQWRLWIIVVIFLPSTSCIYRDFRATFAIKSLVQIPHCKAYKSSLNLEDRRHIPRFQNECLLKLPASYKYCVTCTRKTLDHVKVRMEANTVGWSSYPKTIKSISFRSRRWMPITPSGWGRRSECSSLFTDTTTTALRLLKELKA